MRPRGAEGTGLAMARDLTFGELEQANRERNEERAGTYFLSSVREWTLSQFVTAIAGEVGSAAHIAKKIDGDREARLLDSDTSWIGVPGGPQTVRGALADELADIVIYVDLLAQRIGVELATAVAAKFNATSARRHSKVLL